MREFWRTLAIILLAVLVFGAAKYLDNNPRHHVSEMAQSSAQDEVAETTLVSIEETENMTEAASVSEMTVPETTECQEERFLLTFVGDCTLGANPQNALVGSGFIKMVGEDYGYPFRNVIDWFENDECTFLNLEGPLTDAGDPVNKNHVFRGPTAYINILTENSVEAVSLANNHSMDYGQIGYNSTVTALKNANISFVEQDSSCIFTTENNLTIGVYGAAFDQLDEEAIIAGISELKAQDCDLVIFAPHWGIEGSYRPTVGQQRLGHAAIDAGADIVWGSHPHVLQPIEEYNGGIIYYSLGNFSFGGNGKPGDFDTALIQQELIRAADGTMSLGEVNILPARISSVIGWNNFQPTPYEVGTSNYDRVIKKLDGSWRGPNLSAQK